MDLPSQEPRQLIALKNFVDCAPFSMSTARRLIKKKRLEYAQPGGPGADIYIPEDAFERLVVKPQLSSPSGEVKSEATSKEEDKQKKHPSPRSAWRKRLRAK